MSTHWESTYARTTPHERSWSEDSAKTSLAWIAAASVAKNAAVVDVGGGASHLVDELLSEGYTNVTVVDLSASALAEVKARVGGRATLIEADLLEWTPQEPLGL
jgi:16S rRNA A1518/A1519 N6-dimethyltransferase RsmA/KsgA/DIM1 with predicted DNA glycosylase/AP lyase activity